MFGISIFSFFNAKNQRCQSRLICNKSNSLVTGSLSYAIEICIYPTWNFAMTIDDDATDCGAITVIAWHINVR